MTAKELIRWPCSAVLSCLANNPEFADVNSMPLFKLPRIFRTATPRQLIYQEKQMDKQILQMVRGWLHGEFVLSLDEVAADRGAFVAALEKTELLRDLTPPRIWFENLRYAEYLRSMFRNDR